VTLWPEMHGRPPFQIPSQMSAVGAKIRECLKAQLEAGAILIALAPFRCGFRRVEFAPNARPCTKASQLTSRSGEATAYVDLMLICRRRERILRHLACVADQAVDAAPRSSVNQRMFLTAFKIRFEIRS
jgi:hypothetical protein